MFCQNSNDFTKLSETLTKVKCSLSKECEQGGKKIRSPSFQTSNKLLLVSTLWVKQRCLSEDFIAINDNTKRFGKGLYAKHNGGEES
jgi:hypothetical protein